MTHTYLSSFLPITLPTVLVLQLFLEQARVLPATGHLPVLFFLLPLPAELAPSYQAGLC